MQRKGANRREGAKHTTESMLVGDGPKTGAVCSDVQHVRPVKIKIRNNASDCRGGSEEARSKMGEVAIKALLKTRSPISGRGRGKMERML